MLMPKKVKYRKQQRGRMTGAAKAGATVDFGDYGIQALEPGWITARPDRGCPYRDDSPRPSWWQGLDPGLPGQARDAKACRDPHGFRKGQP